MSFTDDYFAAKKKKKKNETTGHSFTDEYNKRKPEPKTVEDIAPVLTNLTATKTNTKTKSKKDDGERTWFKSSDFFDDGYDFGDVSKTILGTVRDVGENLTTGVVGMGEKILDAGMMLGAAMNESKMMEAANNEIVYNALTGKKTPATSTLSNYRKMQDEVVKGTTEFVKQDLYDEKKVARTILLSDAVTDITGIDPEKHSVLGDKFDSLVQSAGQLAAQYGLQAVGIPWFVTSGITSFGSEAENALNQGATFEEANLSSAITAGAEILTEKLFGGDVFTKTAGADLATKYLSSAISDKIVQKLAKLGLDVGGEAFEEVASQFISNIGTSLYREENLGEILFSEEALDEYLESAIGGGVLGGVMTGVNIARSAKNGVDYVSGLTKNEQAVVDKVYNDAVAEAEKNGKLTAKQKAKLYEEVLDQMDKGYISTDTIEEVLGGETYKSYKDTVDGEDALQAEFDTLNKMKQGEMTGEQIDRRNELKQQLKDLETTSQRNQLKTQLGEEVFGLTKDSRLVESYNERTRRGQAFEADLTQYDAKQQETIKRAVDSGILNNSNRTHEFVDMVAKISADKGVLFDFTDNTKLKESSFAVDGKFVNGYFDKKSGTIGVNIDSAKALNTVVGHEVTHILEGTDVYNTFRDTIVEYAKSKGDYQGRIDSLNKLYAAEDVDSELVADLVGDYLFTDSDFIHKLSTENRNVFQKIYDEIKYLCKVATAGSKEARELERVKKAFEDAYRAEGKTDGEVKHSLSDSDGKQLSKEQQDYFKDSKMRDDNGNLKVMYHGSQDAGFHIFDSSMSDDDTSFFFVDRNDVATTYSGTSETYEAKAFRTAEDANNFFAEIGKDEYEVVEKDGKYTLLDDGDEVATSDDLSEIYDEFRDWEGVGYGDANYKVYLNLKNPLEIDAQGRPWNKIDAEFSQEVYDRYQSLTAEEKEALIDLAEWEDFSLFNREIQEAVNKYDAEDSLLSSAYHKLADNKLKGNEDDVNFYDLFSVAADNFSEEAMRENARNYLKTRDFAQRAKEQGYDGVIFKNIIDNGGYSSGDEGASTVAIAFDSNQIKSVANDKPTADPDIRFSLSESVEETKDLMALHNLSADKLMKSLKLGGLPMPSVAIARGKDGHGEFGEISLILPKETIDPDENANNKLYSGDAWTPTYPSVDYKVSEKVLSNISKKLYGLVPSNVLHDLGRISLDADNMGDTINRYSGNVIEAFKDNDALKYAYLMEAGADITLPMREKNLSHSGSRENGAIIKVAEAIPADEIKKAQNGGYEGLQKLEPVVRKAVAEYVRETYGDDQVILDTFAPAEGLSFSDLDGYLNEALTYHRTGIEKTVDSRPARTLIRDMTVQYSYEEWLQNLFSGIVEKEGIRNNRDYFTPSGNRRSFEALHYEHNLENVIKAMREKGEKGIGNGFGGASIFGAATTEFSSIEDMKQSSDRLQQMSYDEYQELRKGFTDRFLDIALSLPNEKNSFMATDSAAEVLTEAVAKYKTRSGIANYLKRELKGWATYSEQAVDDLIELVNDIRQMPTGYFEAKPQRAVGFDEVGVFVIPRNADIKLKRELLNRGYSIAEYDPDVEGDRQKVVNQFEEYKFSLSNIGEAPKQQGNYNVYGKDIALETQKEVAPTPKAIAPIAESATETEKTEQNVPIAENVAPVTQEEMQELFPDDLAPVEAELDKLNQQKEILESRLQEAIATQDVDAFNEIGAEYDSVMARLEELEADENQRADSLANEEAPPEMEAPYTGEDNLIDPFSNRSDTNVRTAKSYQEENPAAKPFFMEAARVLLGDVESSTPGKRIYNDQLHYDSGGEKGWMGQSRQTPEDVGAFKDAWGNSWEELRVAAQNISEGRTKTVLEKRLEFLLNDRMLYGYTDIEGRPMPRNQAYVNFLSEQHGYEAGQGAFDDLVANGDKYAPIDNSSPIAPIAPVAPIAKESTVAPVAEKYEAIKPKPTKEPRMARATPAEQARAEILTEEPKVKKEKGGFRSKVNNLVLDKGMIFEDLSLATGNRELQARWNSIRYAEGKAQKLIGEGNAFTSSLKSMQEQVEKAGKTKDFYEYLYHQHNVDRMTLEERFKDTPNKTVFGDDVTADVSREAVAKLEAANPEFKQWAEEVYTYNKHLRDLLVEGGVISSETAKLWETMYPHYVPIRRLGDDGLNINVPLDTGKTGVNAPIKRAKGGNRDILPLFDTMAQRTIQTYKAIAKNRFGVELKNTLGTTIENEVVDVDEAIDSIDAQDGLLQEGKNGKKPTFTVFENGEKVTFEITDEMYDAMKPTNELFSGTSKVLNTISNIRRGTLTEYNPWFMLKNAVKDVQDVLINSQHATKTYLNIPVAIKEMTTNGHWYQEYMENGGDQNTYFDNQTNTFAQENKAWEIAKKVTGLDAISKANNIIERLPRLAEYIASRKAKRSIDVAMLDAARVTTNFAAGGDATKWLNRNGATFLNASVQGAMQQARNIREAKANGLKGWASLAAKYTLAGLPAVLLNHLLWDDDEEYEELSDYVKESYYIVGKYNNGQFVRIPKGRTVAVIQNAFEQMDNLITGDDEVDLGRFLDLVVTNLAPNNPIDNNIISPILQVANNETWYGEDLVPTRLQDLPAAEQYDESTDSISRWLGETFNISPVKANYLLDQYSGVIGDTFLPMLTPEAESGDNSVLGNMIAPLKDMFTTDSVMNNQNVSDFYDTMDKLTTNAKSSKATDEDVLKYKYINSVNADLSELYKQKREIQNSSLADDVKYSKVKEIQQQIDSIAKDSLATYENVKIDGGYATVGDLHYRKNKGEWQKLTDKQVEKQEEVTRGLGISPNEYWGNKEEYDFAYEKPEKYAVAKSVGGYTAYKDYSSQLYDIKGVDNDGDGRSDTGTRKEKVIEWVNNLDADYGTRIILFKSEYNADDTYNYDIIDYLNSRNDISYEEMETILKELGFDVDSNGNISWD